jgi:selenocysteine lyase/cysteine desulfurase
VAFGQAVAQVNEIGIDASWQRIQELSGMLRRGLREVPGVRIHDEGRSLCGIVSWTKVLTHNPNRHSVTCSTMIEEEPQEELCGGAFIWRKAYKEKDLHRGNDMEGLI